MFTVRQISGSIYSGADPSVTGRYQRIHWFNWTKTFDFTAAGMLKKTTSAKLIWHFFTSYLIRILNVLVHRYSFNKQQLLIRYGQKVNWESTEESQSRHSSFTEEIFSWEQTVPQRARLFWAVINPLTESVLISDSWYDPLLKREAATWIFCTPVYADENHCQREFSQSV